MHPDIDNIKQKVQSNRDLLDRITAGVPGFKGYVEKKERYETDKIIREFCADKIHSQKGRIDSIAADFFRKSGSNYLAVLDNLSLQFERIFKKCKFADYGSSANLSGAKITEEDENRLLEFDWRILDIADEIKLSVDELASKMEDDFEANFKIIKSKLDEFDSVFEKRKHVLMEVI